MLTLKQENIMKKYMYFIFIYPINSNLIKIRERPYIFILYLYKYKNKNVNISKKYSKHCKTEFFFFRLIISYIEIN